MTKKTRTTAYAEKSLKPLARIYQDSIGDEIEALYDLFEMKPLEWLNPDYVKSAKSLDSGAIFGIIDAQSVDDAWERCSEWREIAEGSSKLRGDELYTAISFVENVCDLFDESGPIVVVSSVVEV